MSSGTRMMASSSSHGQIGVGKALASMSWRQTATGASSSASGQLAAAAGPRVGGQRIGVDAEAPELLGGRRHDPEGPAGRIGPVRILEGLRHADEVRALVLGTDRAGVAAGADLLEHGLRRLEIGRDEPQDGPIEVARPDLVVERGHLDVQLALLAGR